MPKTVAISQSNYIPWKGYFDLISRVDEFILYDDMQFTRRDWRNRNQIKTQSGLLWLTVPVQSKGNYFEAIKNIHVSDPGWAEQHWKTVRASYARAPHFAAISPVIESMYEAAAKEEMLSRVNMVFLQGICEILGITTRLSWSMDYQIVEGKNERLISLCQQAGASRYISGPAAKSYADPTQFESAGLSLEWMDYSSYPPYEQRFGDFVHGVTILDVLFNCGPSAADMIWKHPTKFDS